MENAVLVFTNEAMNKSDFCVEDTTTESLTRVAKEAAELAEACNREIARRKQVPGLDPQAKELFEAVRRGDMTEDEAFNAWKDPPEEDNAD